MKEDSHMNPSQSQEFLFLAHECVSLRHRTVDVGPSHYVCSGLPPSSRESPYVDLISSAYSQNICEVAQWPHCN